MPNEKDDRKSVTLTIEEDLLTKAREAGLKEGRTLSNWIEQLVRSELFPPKTK